MDSFESILSIIDSVFYCVRYTQGILTHQIIQSSGDFLLQAWNYMRVTKMDACPLGASRIIAGSNPVGTAYLGSRKVYDAILSRRVAACF